MRVLLTGHSGFIGSHLFGLLESDPRVTHLFGVSRSGRGERSGDGKATTFRRDLAHTEDVFSLLDKTAPDVIFHLASNPLVKGWLEAPSGLIQDNLVSTANLLASCKPGTRFVLASSCTVYGDRITPCCEDDKPEPTSVYGVTKLASEELVGVYSKSGKINGLSVRLAATVGKGATHGVVPDLVRKLRSPSKTLDLLGDAPGSSKPYTHVSDVAVGMAKFGLDPTISGVLNLCNDDELNIADLAEEVMSAVKIRKPVQWLGEAFNWKGDNRHLLVETTAAHWLGWRPRYTSSREAVRRAAGETE